MVIPVPSSLLLCIPCCTLKIFLIFSPLNRIMSSPSQKSREKIPHSFDRFDCFFHTKLLLTDMLTGKFLQDTSNVFSPFFGQMLRNRLASLCYEHLGFL